jgi:hypothetical protein
MGRPAQRAHHGSFIYQRPEKSPFWYVKVRHGGKRVEVSLRTTDKTQAQLNAVPYIVEHRRALLEAKPVWETVHKLAPRSEVYIVDGQTVIATDTHLITINADGTTRQEPNVMQVVSSIPRLGLFLPVEMPTNPDFVAPPKQTGVVADPDDALFDYYLQHGGLTGHALNEAKQTWVIFKRLVNKPLKSCSREDGRKLAAHLAASGAKGKRSSATVKKQVGRLCAAVNLAIKDGREIDGKVGGPRWSFNPFSGVATQGKDKVKRKPFSPDDIELIKANFDKLDKHDQLLARVLATTGLRLSEAISINSEEAPEHGVRFCIVADDGKTEASHPPNLVADKCHPRAAAHPTANRRRCWLGSALSRVHSDRSRRRSPIVQSTRSWPFFTSSKSLKSRSRFSMNAGAILRAVSVEHVFMRSCISSSFALTRGMVRAADFRSRSILRRIPALDPPPGIPAWRVYIPSPVIEYAGSLLASGSGFCFLERIDSFLELLPLRCVVEGDDIQSFFQLGY